MKTKKMVILLTLLAVFIPGCSSRFAYNNIDWLLYWYVDDYVKLDRSQRSLLDVKIDAWHAWHRNNELEEYRDYLQSIKLDIINGQQASDKWLLHLTKGAQYWERLRDLVIPELTELAVNLTDQQVESFFDVLEEDNLDNIEERADKTPADSLKDNQQRANKQVENWVGPLSAEQKQLVDEQVSLFEPTFDMWISYRRAIQAASKTVLPLSNVAL